MALLEANVPTEVIALYTGTVKAPKPPSTSSELGHEKTGIGESQSTAD